MIQSKEAVTPEMIEAVKILRAALAPDAYISRRTVIDAVKILDDEGFFDLVDEAMSDQGSMQRFDSR